MLFRHLPILLALLLALTAGCAKIPRESVELSVALGEQIVHLEQAHLALLDSFFTEQERRIDRFISEQWAPAYHKNLLQRPEIDGKWQAVVNSGEAADRRAFFNWISPVIQQAIIDKRRELLAPLAETERLLRQQLQESYLRAYAMNDSLTRLLDAAATLQSKQQRYQRLLGIEPDLISGKLAQVDATVNGLLNKGAAVKDQAEQTQRYLQSLKELAALIRQKGAP